MGRHNDYFSILDSSATNLQIINAGYTKGITRTSLDGSKILIQHVAPLPPVLNSYVITKDKKLEGIRGITESPEWHDNTGGI